MPDRQPVKSKKKKVRKVETSETASKKTATRKKKPSRKTIVRCPWVGATEDYLAYHDKEWGVPEHDDHRLFECLTLEGAQAGLSWLTILNKRDNYRKAFRNFDPARVARYTEKRRDRLMNDAGIVRNRLKIESTINNAKAILKLYDEGTTLDAYFWQFVDGKPIQPGLKTAGDYPALTDLSKTISKDLKKHGFRFIGPTTVYAFMQAVGMVNDHTVTCFRHGPVKRMK